MVIAQAKPIAKNISPESEASDGKVRMTLEEYRAIAETSEERYEYRNGEMITISGATETHSTISVNLLSYLGFLLRDTDFQLYNSALRVWISDYNCGTYTDLMVVNGEPVFNQDRTDEILNPLLIVEVLSPSTEGYDRGDKFRKYRSIPSFCEYLLVSQSEPYVEQYYQLDRQNNNQNNRDRWQLEICDRLEQAIHLQSLNLELPMSEIYRRIKF
ncbi:Uma2 family endonuclease [Pseudanabaena sp. UWO310]|uniref:Uma2 family endonuclease n=1 Tax=Pseudanabaena sp. UWO310 TaxID=2480795 RepID=UPI00115C1B4D|nr:Uma2 family endonuclease [Pseudanabaena sp. UWO310]TYQ30868.1 Uma2 family endonuclease [Pseudanabaena sp. UWO310]